MKRIVCPFAIVCIYIMGFFVMTAFAQQNNDFYRNGIQKETQITLPTDLGFQQDDELVEGDSCVHFVHRTKGVCVSPNLCPEVIRDFRNGIQPQICSYNGNRPVICCPRIIEKIATSTTSAPTTERVNEPHFQPSFNAATFVPSNLRISEQKCKQYSKLAVEENFITSFSVGERVNSTVQKAKCTLTGGGGFIVGGTKTKAGEFPHMAAIGWPQGDGSVAWNCGGSLISYYFVLSAAHCTSDHGIPPKTIRLGEQNLKRTDDDTEVQDYSIEQMIRHPNYKRSSKYNDIALFKLDRRVRVSDYIRPACLWQSFNINYTSAIATGWGLTTDRGRKSDELLKVSLNLIANDLCNDVYERFNALKDGIIDTQLCAGAEDRDTCNGDSGGPIQIQTPKYACSYHIIGLTSFGRGCGNSYGVYTRVSEFLDWIESEVWKYAD